MFPRSFAAFLASFSLIAGAATADAQFLAERLVPPQSVAIPAFPNATPATTGAMLKAERIPSHLWSLPVAPLPGAPTQLATEATAVNWSRPVIDPPILAFDPAPLSPSNPILATAPKSFVRSDNPNDLPHLGRFPVLTDPAARATDDPSFEAAFTLLTGVVPLAVPSPAPLLRFAVPDPFEQLKIIRLATPPADADGSAVALDRPAPQPLPMVASPKDAAK